MCTQDTIAAGTIILRTFIPARRQVEGLEYGADASHGGYDCYYVRPVGAARWGLARDTVADDELETDIVGAIRREIEAAASSSHGAGVPPEKLRNLRRAVMRSI